MRRTLLAAVLSPLRAATTSRVKARCCPVGQQPHVGQFVNVRARPADARVHASLEDEVARRGIFKLMPSTDAAAVVLEGSIDGLETRPVAFSNSDEAVQYETIMTISAQLRDPRNEKVVWRVSGCDRTTLTSSLGTVDRNPRSSRSSPRSTRSSSGS
jgi:hypothetical protein